MRNSARGRKGIVDKRVGPWIVLYDLFVGAILGAPNDPGPPTRNLSARKSGLRKSGRDA